jgi:uncharacterized protein
MNAIGNPLGVQREQTMEEILASIRKIIESNEAMTNAAREDEDALEAPAIAQNAMIAPDITPDVAVAPEAKAAAASVPQQADAPEQDNALQAAMHEAADVPAIATIDMPAAEHETVPAVVEAKPSLQSEMARLMSRPAERQVAASFDGLNQAVNLARELPLQTMAEAMLKPMLKDWLDNNLPTMVERLVREEITRIARGDV